MPAWAMPLSMADSRLVSRTTSVAVSADSGARKALPRAVLAPQAEAKVARALIKRAADPERTSTFARGRATGRAGGSPSVIPGPRFALAVFTRRPLVLASRVR